MSHRRTFKLFHGQNPLVPDADVLLAAVEESLVGMSDPGFCLYCGDEVHGVEPDARGYPCEGCGESEVYGAEEVLLMYGDKIT